MYCTVLHWSCTCINTSIRLHNMVLGCRIVVTTTVKLKLKLDRSTVKGHQSQFPFWVYCVWFQSEYVTSVPAGSHSLLSVGRSNALCTQTEMNGWKYPDLPIKSEFYRRCLLHYVLFLTHCVYLKSRNVLPGWCQFNKQDVTLKRFPGDSEWKTRSGPHMWL